MYKETSKWYFGLKCGPPLDGRDRGRNPYCLVLDTAYRWTQFFSIYDKTQKRKNVNL